jgi:hypothetical protein
MARDPEELAAGLYEDFHRYPPRKVGEFGAGFKIPDRVHRQGKSINVLYRSGKVDPETLKKPRKPVDYIHEHDSKGVTTYLTKGDGPGASTPDWLRDADALVLLGSCLGFAFEGPRGKLVTAEGRAPLPELYATTNGKALLVIQGKRDLIALVWGGKLNVEPRGIVG